MTGSSRTWVALLALIAANAIAAPAADAPVVVVLHGLVRSPESMRPMVRALEAAGYRVCNVAYPSREHPIAVLAADHVAPALARCAPGPATPLNFVAHSLGAIIIRQLAATGTVKRFGRVVMLSPPNHGSEVTDSLGGWLLYDAINGPAGQELGTAPDALPKRLGPAPFETGIITGDRSINWGLSTIIPGADDGKVSVASARLDGMKDFIVVHVSHPFIMKDRETIAQTLHFLAHGLFVHGDARHPLPGGALFATLKDLCGATFEGRSVFPTDPEDSFFGKPLVARIASCTDDEIRVPFAVGEDRSRTWVLTRSAAGVTLKHDHRHADGSPDAQTGYGGLATPAGSAQTQNFAADAHTAALIPAAHSNVWTISLAADGRTLAYILNRDGKLRFEARLQRVATP